MTLQEIFNRAVEGLAAQGFEPSRADDLHDAGCRYRGAGGRKCAVGHLIDDRHYARRIEGKGVDWVEVQSALRRSGVTVNSESIHFLLDLQAAHDDPAWMSSPADTMRDRLRAVATKHRLTLPEALQ